jgi:NAD(P)H-hydrate epimerase
MGSFANAVFAQANVRAIDQRAITSHGIPGFTLMERAAAATVAAAVARWPKARRWLVVCGGGNNGGDGYVIARMAAAAGCEVSVRSLVPTADLVGDAARAAAEFLKAGGPTEPFTGKLPIADLVIDALLGTGLGRPVTGAWLQAISAINEQHAPVVAVDIPSGLDAGTGAVLGAAVRAALTVTFVGRKTGLYLGDGPEYTGSVEFADLGIPAAAYADIEARFRLFDETELQAILPPRRATAHKGHFGHVLVVGGNHGMAGAVRLAGEAALRAGSGLVTVATRPANAPLLTGSRPELMTVAVESAGDLDPALARCTVVAIGPGLGTDDWAHALFERILKAGRPMVVDADALNILAAAPVASDAWILTPHPGEAARLLGWTSATVQADRLGALSALVNRYGGTVTLKGRGTLVGAAGPCPWLIDAGNPGMASGGMGDVLTGLTAGILAQAPGDPHRAAAAAAFVHARAGDSAAGQAPRGLLASDLLAAVRPCINPAP